MQHKTVLLETAVDALALASASRVVDATLGAGGHTQAIAEQLDHNGHIIACDIDPDAIKSAQLWKDSYAVPITLHIANFKNVHTTVSETLGPTACVDGILADLGWRMDQFTDSGRGFSFTKDEPLQMTYGDPAAYELTAASIVNEWDESDIANVLFGYGEERYSRRIAAAIIKVRQQVAINSAAQLADIITEAVPAHYRRRRVHPATKSFQALRIAVNDELLVLDEFITNAMTVLSPGGRLVIITFHSLEDRIVKHRFRELAATEQGELPHRKPLLPEPDECVQNPRARSAKLRTIIKR